MTSLKRQIHCTVVALLGAGVCLWAAGCGSLPNSAAGPFDLLRMPPLDFGAKADDEAFKEAVEDDPFPTAGQAAVQPLAAWQLPTEVDQLPAGRGSRPGLQ